MNSFSLNLALIHDLDSELQFMEQDSKGTKSLSGILKGIYLITLKDLFLRPAFDFWFLSWMFVSAFGPVCELQTLRTDSKYGFRECPTFGSNSHQFCETSEKEIKDIHSDRFSQGSILRCVLGY